MRKREEPDKILRDAVLKRILAAPPKLRSHRKASRKSKSKQAPTQRRIRRA